MFNNYHKTKSTQANFNAIITINKTELQNKNIKKITSTHD